jgi:putative aminopeptidase FrvX
MKTLLHTLTQIPAPSGREDELRAAVQKMIQPYADEIRVDALGNLIVRKGKQAKNGKRIMLAAHLDEVGFIVSYVDADGFARFSVLGVPHQHRRVGARLKFLNGASGVIGLEKTSELKDRAPGVDKFFIDTGATSSKDSPVKVGDVAVFDADFQDLGGRVVSKALDNRVGVALLIESLRNFKSGPHEIYYVFTAQEEVGVRGAGPAAYGLDPEIGISVDVTPASDMPAASLRNPIAPGKGPAVKIKDSLMLSDPRLVDALTRLAQKSHLPLQMEVLEDGSTDARAIQIAGSGARVAGLSVPVRYGHSPSEMADWGDIQNAGRLLAALLRSTDL